MKASHPHHNECLTSTTSMKRETRKKRNTQDLFLPAHGALIAAAVANAMLTPPQAPVATQATVTSHSNSTEHSSGGEVDFLPELASIMEDFQEFSELANLIKSAISDNNVAR
jgi:hypothetical protein